VDNEVPYKADYTYNDQQQYWSVNILLKFDQISRFVYSIFTIIWLGALPLLSTSRIRKEHAFVSALTDAKIPRSAHATSITNH
jgi:hypothetical protein